jgi:hypothetical protein
VLLSGRSRWQWLPSGADRGEIHVYDSAAVVDGRCRIGGYALAGREAGARRDVAFVLFPSLGLDDERRLYELTRTQLSSTSRRAPLQMWRVSPIPITRIGSSSRQTG